MSDVHTTGFEHDVDRAQHRTGGEARWFGEVLTSHAAVPLTDAADAA